MKFVCLVEIALSSSEIAEPFVRDAKVKLPRGVGRVGFGQPLPDAERLAEQPLGLGQIPHCHGKIAETVETD